MRYYCLLKCEALCCEYKILLSWNCILYWVKIKYTFWQMQISCNSGRVGFLEIGIGNKHNIECYNVIHVLFCCCCCCCFPLCRSVDKFHFSIWVSSGILRWKVSSLCLMLKLGTWIECSAIHNRTLNFPVCTTFLHFIKLMFGWAGTFRFSEEIAENKRCNYHRQSHYTNNSECTSFYSHFISTTHDSVFFALFFV